MEEKKRDRMTNQVVTENDVKKGISDMYYAMSKKCRHISDEIETDIDNYTIQNQSSGYELECANGRKYQLILELKEVKE